MFCCNSIRIKYCDGVDMVKTQANALTLGTNEKNVDFEIELSINGFNIFKSLVKKEHYLFNPEMLMIRKAMIETTGVEPVSEIKPIAADKLSGLVQRISYKRFKTPMDVDDLELYYIPDRNKFMLKFLSSVSDEFDYIAEVMKSKGA
ncbi:hypothetical protein OX88_21600 [Pseudomonas coronafaciens pv. porri]|nr:hypothetical protein OX88_21600 [Pseudomonas coronafaciens pv. porri]